MPHHKKTYHIRVIKTARCSNFREIGFVITIEVYYAIHGVPGVADIAIVAPDVAVMCNLYIVWLQNI